MTEHTLEPGELRVASALPDLPFEVTIDGIETGFDIELMRNALYTGDEVD